MINAVWAVFGVSDGAARLVPALIGGAALLATGRAICEGRAAPDVCAAIRPTWAAVPALERTGATGAAVAAAQAAGHPVAQLRRYQGPFHFAGRLREPVTWFDAPGDLAVWARAHPDGYVLLYTHGPPTGDAGEAERVAP